MTSFEARVARRRAELDAASAAANSEALAAGKVRFRGLWCDGPVLREGRRLYVRRWTSPEGEECETVAVASLSGRRYLALWIRHGAWMVGYVLRGSRKELQFAGASLEDTLAQVAIVHG